MGRVQVKDCVHEIVSYLRSMRMDGWAESLSITYAGLRQQIELRDEENAAAEAKCVRIVRSVLRIGKRLRMVRRDNAALRARLAEVEEDLKTLHGGLGEAQKRILVVAAERDTEQARATRAEAELVKVREASALLVGQEIIRADKAEARVEKLRRTLALIADTDPDEGTAWFHATADSALSECGEG